MRQMGFFRSYTLWLCGLRTGKERMRVAKKTCTANPFPLPPLHLIILGWAPVSFSLSWWIDGSRLAKIPAGVDLAEDHQRWPVDSS